MCYGLTIIIEDVYNLMTANFQHYILFNWMSSLSILDIVSSLSIKTIINKDYIKVIVEEIM